MKLAFKKALFRAAILASTLPYLTTSSYGMLPEEEGKKTSSSKLCQAKLSSNTVPCFSAIDRKIQRKKRNGSNEPSQTEEVSSFASLYNLGQAVVQRKKQGDPLLKTSTDGILTLEKAKAFYWWYRAQNQNDPEAWRKLGKLYEAGEGVEKNYSEARKCYLNISEQNDAEIQFKIGSLYEEDSEEIKKDSAEAIKWYLKAAAQNHAKALYRLWKLYCKDVEKGHKAAFECLQRMPLKMIDSHTFHDCNLADTHASQVASLLSQTKHLEWISLSHNKFTSQGLKIILDALQSYPNLLELNIDYNPIDDEGGKELLAFLQKHPSLEKISAQGRFMGAHMSREIEHLINKASALKIKPSRLHGHSYCSSFSNCDFTDQDAPQVASLLSQIKDVSNIDLSDNKFTSQGLKIILNALQSCPNLRELYIDNNLIDDEGGKELLVFLRKHHSLKKISAQWNTHVSREIEHSINRESALRIKPASLSAHSYSASFRNCDFTDQDAPQVASLLSQIKDLRWATLSNNKFTSQGLKIILNTLQSYPNLYRLCIDNNLINDEGGKELLIFVEKHPILETLYVDGNPMSPEMKKSIQAVLKKNNI